MASIRLTWTTQVETRFLLLLLLELVNQINEFQLYRNYFSMMEIY